MLEPQNERFVRDFLNCSHFVATKSMLSYEFSHELQNLRPQNRCLARGFCKPPEWNGNLCYAFGKKTIEYNKNMGSCKCSLKKQSFDPYSTHHRFPPPAAAGRPRYRLGELRNWSWVLFTHPIWLILIVNTNIKTNLWIEPTTKYPSNWWDPRKKMEYPTMGTEPADFKCGIPRCRTIGLRMSRGSLHPGILASSDLPPLLKRSMEYLWNIQQLGGNIQQLGGNRFKKPKFHPVVSQFSWIVFGKIWGLKAEL